MTIHGSFKSINCYSGERAVIGNLGILALFALSFGAVSVAQAQTDLGGSWEITARSHALVENFDEDAPTDAVSTFLDQSSLVSGIGSLNSMSFASQAGATAFAETHSDINTTNNFRSGIFTTSGTAGNTFGFQTGSVGANAFGGTALVQWGTDRDEGFLDIAYAYVGREDSGASVAFDGASNGLGVGPINTSLATGLLRGELGTGSAHRLDINGGAGAISTPGYTSSSFAVTWGVNGLPGASIASAFMPKSNETPGSFEFTVPVLPGYGVGSMLYFDPIAANAYEYFVDGSHFASFTIPEPLPGGDDMFQLEFDGNVFDLAAGDVFDFTSVNSFGVSQFLLFGLEFDEIIDPSAHPPFISGLSFTTAGIANVQQIARTISVPEPNSVIALTCVGLAIARRRFQRSRLVLSAN